MSSWLRRRTRDEPWSGRRRTLRRWGSRLTSVAICVVALAGCATGPPKPAYLPTIPARPTWSEDQIRGHEAEGRSYVIVEYGWWLELSEFVLRLESELRGACLALGGTDADCRVPPQP